MKNIFLVIYLILFISINHISGSILNEKGIIKNEIIDIFKIFIPYIKENSNKNIDKILEKPTIFELNNIAQSLFLRPKNCERDFKESIEHYTKIVSLLSESEKDDVLELMRNLGCLGDIFPKKNKYDYIIIHGGIINTMIDRIKFFLELIKKKKININDSKLYFLCGERIISESEIEEVILRSDLRNFDFISFISIFNDERDIAKICWNQLKMSSSIKDKKMIFVEAKKKLGSKRSTTEDCVKEWIKRNLSPGSCLVISSNPFVIYQNMVTKLVVLESNHFKKKEFIFEGVGIDRMDFYSKDILIGYLMDNLSRILYVENKL